MLHAPASETKTQAAHQAAPPLPERARELSPRAGTGAVRSPGALKPRSPEWSILQRAYGNQAVLGLVQRRCAGGSPHYRDRPGAQPLLTVSQPRDFSEQEADRVAAAVVSGAVPELTMAGGASGALPQLQRT
jgi:hypothetical protein